MIRIQVRLPDGSILGVIRLDGEVQGSQVEPGGALSLTRKVGQWKREGMVVRGIEGNPQTGNRTTTSSIPFDEAHYGVMSGFLAQGWLIERLTNQQASGEALTQ